MLFNKQNKKEFSKINKYKDESKIRTNRKDRTIKSKYSEPLIILNTYDELLKLNLGDLIFFENKNSYYYFEINKDIYDNKRVVVFHEISISSIGWAVSEDVKLSHFIKIEKINLNFIKIKEIMKELDKKNITIKKDDRSKIF